MVPTRQSCRRNPAIPEMVGFLNVPRDKRLIAAMGITADTAAALRRINSATVRKLARVRMEVRGWTELRPDELSPLIGLRRVEPD